MTTSWTKCFVVQVYSDTLNDDGEVVWEWSDRTQPLTFTQATRFMLAKYHHQFEQGNARIFEI